MKLRLHLLAALAASTLSACGAQNGLWQAEQSCLKYPTPGARADCEAKARDDNAAFVKETQKNKDEAKAKQDSSLDTKKKNPLCFKRESSGETVCPN